MRGYKTLIQEAELMAMPPEAVAEFLKGRANQTKHEAHDDPVDKDAEKALRGRANPLIDLSLARYGRHIEVVSELFQSADANVAPSILLFHAESTRSKSSRIISGSNSPLRLACLANRSVGLMIFASFPVGLLGREPGPMAEWLLTATNNELLSLFENPTLDNSFLRDLLKRSRGWEAIPDDKLCDMVYILHRNPRMRTPRDEDYMDSWLEYSYDSVFDAAWKLAETAPVNEDWAFSLGCLYDQLQTDAFSIKDPLKLAERWHIDPADKKASARQAEDHEIGHLGNMEQVRKGLARLALSKSGKLLAYLLASDDLALRAAAYAAGNLNAEQLRAGSKKDGELFLTEALRNTSLWRSQGARQALHDISWDVVNNHRHSDLMAANEYNSMEKDMRMKHPTWFADEEGGQSGDDDDDQSPATKADISSLAGHLDLQAQGTEAVVQALRSLMSRTGWIWWFSLGALVASLRHF